MRLSEELATEGYRQVQEGTRGYAWVRVGKRRYARVRECTCVYKLLSCQSVYNSFDSAQFILKELGYMNDRPINGKLVRNGE